MWNGLRKCLYILSLLVVFGSPVFGQMFYAASEPTQQLDQVNFTAGTMTDLYDIGDKPDSLVVNTQGQIIYTVTHSGNLNLYDPKTGTNTVLTNFGTGGPRDMVFDPGGNTLLIALYTSVQLARYDLTTGQVTIFPAKAQTLGSSLDGLAYDPNGNLYAVVSHNTICQLDPNTGAVLQTLVLEPHNTVDGGDGMVYDPFTKNLWVSHDGTNGNGLIEIPLTESTPPVMGTPILLQTGNIHVPDGIISDGKGNLYIGEGLQYLTQYSIPSDTIVKRVPVPGIDSVAFAPANFLASLTTANGTVLDGDTAAYTLNVSTSDGSTPTLQVTCSGLPAPAVCTAPTSVGVGQSSIQVQSQTLAVGTYNFTVAVTDGIVVQKLSSQLNVGDFGASLQANAVTIGVGQSGTIGAVVTGQNSFSDVVALSCTAPAGATCAFSPSSVNASAAGTPSTLTVSVASRPANSSRQIAKAGQVLGASTIALGMFAIVGLPGALRRRLGVGGWFSLTMLLLCSLLLISCGGSSSGSGGNGGGGGGSNPTTFTVSVQASAHTVTKNLGNVTVTVP